MRMLIVLLSLILLSSACRPEEYDFVYEPTAVNLVVPQGFPPLPDFPDNPLTQEGINLGRKLFYDPILSGDNTQSCASCHQQSIGFSDSMQFSIGIDGIAGNRQAMPIFNLAYADKFFWDGRANSLTDQALGPVPNPIEMHQAWPDAVDKLENHSSYPALFMKAFGEPGIDSLKVAKAIAQFERTIFSSNSRYDKAVIRKEFNLTDAETRGLFLFVDQNGADCWHCHPISNNLLTDFSFRNNGLDTVFQDSGLAAVTGLASDLGKFKVPSLRNIEYTAPYMHDGRFKTLEEVIEFYNTGGHPSPYIDSEMEFVGIGLNLTEQEKSDLLSFLLALSDPDFLLDERFEDPNE